MKTLVVIDNFDSFTFNLVQLLRAICEPKGIRTTVVRNRVSLDHVLSFSPCGVVLSPGPGGPRDGGVSLEVVHSLDVSTPVLGVCLGHQLLASAYGAKVVQAARPIHGKRAVVNHSNTGIFSGLPPKIHVGRYHSLIVEKTTLPTSLRETAWTDEGEIMGLEHTNLPRWGVQFHPESFLSENGNVLVENFVSRL